MNPDGERYLFTGGMAFLQYDRTAFIAVITVERAVSKALTAKYCNDLLRICNLN